MIDPQVLAQLQGLNQNLAALIKTLTSVFPNSGGKAAAATAGAATLPANPVGFVIITLPDGTTGKVPYYNL